ncbi:MULTISPECIES: hypothetical protein [unclassified Aureispira]|uniref:hypothetical protein n=1 Tax=unclassified Aureispira TaxID=2649989 RepID=UPI0006965BC4|nr:MULTISPECIES: hypothetical protein [unclassified Aureispira]WMX15451.1 hypothetical protein QP953_03560 [Aureispira sp. CCB-E]
MLKRLSLIFLLLSVYLFSCDTSRSYTLEELESNTLNTLDLRIDSLDANDYQDLFDEFQNLDKEQILEQLNAKGLELHRASYGFYYLANQYAIAGEMESAKKYHYIAAENYLNPQSLLKLAEFNFHITKDYKKAYEYLYQSLEITVEITENNRSHPVAKNGKERKEFLRQELKRMGEKNLFDEAATITQLKKELPPLMKQYRAMYDLSPRVDS